MAKPDMMLHYSAILVSPSWIGVSIYSSELIWMTSSNTTCVLPIISATLMPSLLDAALSRCDDYVHFSVKNGGTICDEYASQSVGDLTERICGPYKDLFNKLAAVPPSQLQETFETAWNELTKPDRLSTRGYMLAGKEGKPTDAPDPYPESVVQWLEIFDSATGLYDHAFVETVLDAIALDWPSERIPSLASSVSSRSIKNTSRSSDGLGCVLTEAQIILSMR
ncbi:hypothetical protein A0H81_03215 [Grifola frondosa]|uniref:Uncharacterized protein n=1 Tax=Grifola frondosa TaxID=5627 RepID=A0A1C7MMG9_GRIFR|nr:hypothetical protein A0H81_03215 [Grifola frondosa]